MTGQGYSDKKKGIKTSFPDRELTPEQPKRETQRKHYSIYFYWLIIQNYDTHYAWSLNYLS